MHILWDSTALENKSSLKSLNSSQQFSKDDLLLESIKEIIRPDV